MFSNRQSNMRLLALYILAHLAFIQCEVFFGELFTSDNVLDKWVKSEHDADQKGVWEISAGTDPADPEAKGFRTTQDAKFYAISSKFDKPFSNKDKDLVIQFTVKHEQNIDCGGGYVKVMGSNIDQKDFHGETPYHIMFGPDICGLSTKKVHVIFHYKEKNHLIEHDIECKHDTLTHLYTLIVTPKNKYKVLIDNEVAREGTLEDDWQMLLPKEIPDASKTKPTDWVDEEEIVDQDDQKPADWDKPKSIPDPNAKKPDDWDDEMDGEWEAPVIDNPDYKGDWEPKKIPNPAYKGPWIQPKIDNPDYKHDPELYKFDDIGSIGFDLWQVKSGTIFGQVLVTDDAAHAAAEAEKRWKPLFDAETTKKEKETPAKEEEAPTPDVTPEVKDAEDQTHDEL